MKYTLDTTIFDNIDNEYKAYTLGYLFAKGSVYRGNDASRFELTISDTDPEQLSIIKEQLGSNHHIVPKGGAYCIRIVNKEFVSKLENLGLTAYKTDTLPYPTYIIRDLKRHFVRGYFDGKGSFMLEEGRRLTSNISAGSYRFIEGLRDDLVVAGLSRANIHKYGAQASTNMIRYYVFDTRRLFYLLYTDARIYSRSQQDRGLRGV